MKFDTIAKKYGSDKSYDKHGYMTFYEEKFSHLCHTEIILAEIGLQITPQNDFRKRIPTDFPSMRMWRDIFSKSKLYGFDLSDFSKIADGFTFHHGDSSNIGDLEEFGQLFGQADIIIEDASHATTHQINALYALTPHIKSGGWFVIEDLHWQPYAEHDVDILGKTIEMYLNGEDTTLNYILDQYENIDLKIYPAPGKNFDTYRIVFLQKK